MNKNYNKNMKEYLLIKNRINNLLIFNIKEDKIKFMKIKNLKNHINNKILKRQMLQFQVISFKKQNNILKINLNKYQLLTQFLVELAIKVAILFLSSSPVFVFHSCLYSIIFFINNLLSEGI